MKILLAPVSVLFFVLVWIRRKLFKYGLFSQVQSQSFVISVGNLTVGGTGKTPVIAYLINCLLRYEKKISVVSRIYRAQSTEDVAVVSSQEVHAAQFGDEPSSLAKLFPRIQVVVSKSKSLAVQWLNEFTKPDIILVDDALQHLRLKRDLEVIVLDASQRHEDYRLLPWGLARDPFSVVQMADLIILSKVNQASPIHLAKLRQRLRSALGDLQTPVLEFNYVVAGLSNIKGDYQFALDRFQSQMKVVLVSGIGRPSSFGVLLKSEFPQLEIIEHVIYSDHHPYTMSDIEHIESIKNKNSAQYVFTTSKDAIKLMSYSVPFQDWVVLNLGLSPVGSQDAVYDILDKNIGKRL